MNIYIYFYSIVEKRDKLSRVVDNILFKCDFFESDVSVSSNSFENSVQFNCSNFETSECPQFCRIFSSFS